ncbi:MAG: NAD(P)-dependent oxidoreductase [Parvularculaceae bacterium]|nr:NAD(P)-dependent oxidoreductase [Parvularculaceae bacterium]
MRTVAILGLGAMGAAMAARWRSKGVPLVAYNRNRARAAPLEAAGVRVFPTAREAAAAADIVVSMVADDDASRQIWQGADGGLEGVRQGAIVIDASTVSPVWARELAARAAIRGAAALDAPVGGGPAAAAAGELAIFVGGEASTLESAREALAIIGSRIEHMGAAGSGAAWKLINYMMAGAQLAGLAEALTLAAKAGIDPARAGALIAKSVVASPAIVGKLPRMVERRFAAPDAALRLVAKDQRYALDLARALGADLEILPVVAAIYARAEREGLGDLDLAAVLESVSRRSTT